MYRYVDTSASSTQKLNDQLLEYEKQRSKLETINKLTNQEFEAKVKYLQKSLDSSTEIVCFLLIKLIFLSEYKFILGTIDLIYRSIKSMKNIHH